MAIPKCVKQLLLVLSLMYSFPLSAQNSYEYWFDDNFSNRQTIPLSISTTETVVSGNADISNVSFGIHRFNFRTIINNSPSPVTTNLFFKNGHTNDGIITHYEYWFNNNINSRKLVALTNPSSDVVALNSVNTDSTCYGKNLVNFRFKMGDFWSPVVTDTFFNPVWVTPITAVAKFDVVTNVRTAFFIDSTKNVTQKTWNFGDGTPLSNLGNPQHTYASFGAYNVCLAVTGTCRDSTFCQTVVARGIKSVSPNRIANQGNFPLTIIGGFPAVSSVYLNKNGSQIIADSFRQFDETSLLAFINPNGVSTGVWALIVNYGNGTSDTLLEAIRIDLFSPFNFSTSINRGAILSGRPTPTQIIVNNNSNQNAYGVPLSVVIEGIAALKLLTPVDVSNISVRVIDSLPHFTTIIDESDGTVNQVGKFIIPFIEANGSFSLGVEIASSQGDALKIYANVSANFTLAIPTIDDFNLDRSADCFFCLLEASSLITNKKILTPDKVCLVGYFTQMGGSILRNIRCGITGRVSQCSEVSDVLWGAASSFLNCVEAFVPVKKYLGEKLAKSVLDYSKGLSRLLSTTSLAESISEECLPCLGFPMPPLRISVVTSADPNEKLGPTGDGSTSHHIKGNAPMDYTIYFENKASATSPALKVLIKDQLDLGVFDVNTFTFTEFGFADNKYELKDVGGEFVQDIDMRPAKNIILRVYGKLDKQTGLMTMTYSSFDPTTMDLTFDIFEGFLPPGNEGFMSYRVGLHEGLSHGQVIQNKADIIFDFNEAIVTPTWLNTLDKITPQSNVQSLAAIQRDTFITISFAGSDAGSGISGYQLYVSENNGDFVFVGSTSSTIQFKGKNGASYRFFSVAYDKVGNVEGIKTSAEATTRIELIALPIEMLDFRATLKDAVVWLEWDVATEKNVSHFDIQRSVNGVTWETIAQKKARGSSHTPFTYAANDAFPKKGINYYRIKTIDLDATHTESKVRSIEVFKNSSKDVKVYPNPTNREIQIASNDALIENITITNAIGQTIFQKSYDKTRFITVNLGEFNDDLYHVSIKTSSGVYVEKIFKKGK